LDGITLSVIRCEITGYLPLKVQKVQQPGKKEIVLSLWNPSVRERLILSLEGEAPFFGFSGEKRETSPSPPGFCLGLRKRLEGRTLADVRQSGLDRVLYLDFDGHDDFGGRARYVLVFDMAGRGQNVGLYRDGLLEAAMLPVDGDRFERGSPYSPPPGGRLDLRDLACGGDDSVSRLSQALLASDGGAIQVLCSTVEGVGKELARGVLAASGQAPASRFSPAGAMATASLLVDFSRVLCGSQPPKPCIYVSPKGLVFHVLPLAHLPVDQEFRTALEGARAFRERTAEIRELSSQRAYAESLHKRILKKVQSRHDAQVQDLVRSRDFDKYKVWAQLIDLSGKRNPPGASSMIATDYYTDPPVEVVVPLDPRYSSRDNARIYYRAYAKLARGEKVLEESVSRLKGALNGLAEARLALDEAVDAPDLARVRSRLESMAKAEGISVRPRKRTGARDRTAPGGPAPAESVPGPDGSIFFVGGNARQNDYLVAKLRKPGDVWLHAKGQKGAHVLVRSPAGQAASDEALLAAAKLAATRCEARGASKVEVDYVDAMKVRKPRDGAPGFVTYTGQKTMVVSPE
jgi:predicted ribosome quality control (RQC) complex YloA/Tae2 family protein